MATYGVSYSSRPRSYGVQGSLASMFGDTPMQPMSSAKPFTSIAPTPFRSLASIVPGASPDGQPSTPTNPTDTTSGTPAPLPPFANPTVPPVSAAPSSNYQGTDLSADPILNAIKDVGRRSVGNAATSGLAGAKNDLINFGSLQIPQSLRDLFAAQTPSQDDLLGALPDNPVLAALNDAGTAAAAAGNPFSTTRKLADAHTANQHQIDQTDNLANLYYSSTHANQLGDENNAYLGSQNSALQTLAQALSGDNTGLLGALNSAHDQYLNELPNAYERAIAAGGTGATGGTGGTTPPPSGDGTAPAPFIPTDSPYWTLLGLARANAGQGGQARVGT
jgi:hypothetical protein